MRKLFALTLVLALCSLVGRAKPAHAASCVQICGANYSQCNLDCRFDPYPGCTNDCHSEYIACVSAC
jgi:hypothetical protein